MRCGRCQHDNPAAAKFCAECGARLGIACPACQAPNRPGSRFCHHCGSSLAEAPAPPSPQTYTPGHLARKILTARDSLAGERKQVTVLFADLKGSLELMADRDPEDARALLDAVLERMMDAVHRFEGTVNQVMGDGIMALFGAPLAHEDHAVRACYAALRMHRTVGDYAEELRRRHGVDVQIRVGLNSGEVVVRSIGNDLQMDYTAVGQTTHLAARMEQLARPGTTLVTAATYRLAERAIDVEPLGPVPVKGLREPVAVYQLRAARPGASRLQATSARALTRLVGRDEELALLHRALAPAAAGHGQVVALVGEPGVGKSRLIWEFVQSSATDGWRVMEASAVSYGASTPYLPIRALLAGYFGVQDSDDPRAIRRKVTQRLVALDPALAAAVPAILAIGNLSDDDPEWRVLHPVERRERIFRAVTQVLLRESARGPLLLVVENLHWLDSESQSLLDSLVETVAGARILVLVAYRPEFRHRWVNRSFYTQVRVTPLSPGSTQALLDGLLGPGADLLSLKALLAGHTDGNPFFLEETVHALVETNVLGGERGAYRLLKPLDAIRIPERVQAVLAARIDRLPQETKAFLQAGAVIGKDVPVALLERISGLPHEDIVRGLAELEAAEFLQTSSLFPELRYSFRHALTHDVAYASLLREQRRVLHARIVDAIEALYPDRRAEHVESLAHHAREAEQWPAAVGYLREAARKALARSANREAVSFLESALDALRHLPESRETFAEAVDVRLDLHPPLLQVGRLETIRTLSEEAAAMAEQLGDDARLSRACTHLTNYHYLRGEPDRALQYGRRCLAIAERAGDEALATLAYRYMGQCHHAQGRYPEAAALFERALATLDTDRLADAPAALTSYVASCGWLAFTLAEQGEFDQAERLMERARALAQTSRHPYSEAIASTLTGLVWAAHGDAAHATEPLSRSLALCRERQLTIWQPIPSSLLGLCLVNLGRAAEGMPLLEESVRLSEDLGVRAYAARWMTHLGEGLLAGDDQEQAATTARRALDLARGHDEAGHEALALRLLGETAARRTAPDRDDAAAHYGRALELAERLGMRPLMARTHLDLGRVERAAGRLAEAEEHLARAVVLFSALGMRAALERSAPELSALGRLLVVSRGHVPLYEYLSRGHASDPAPRVVLDRRRAEAAAAPPSDRRRRSVDDKLRTRGVAVVTE